MPPAGVVCVAGEQHLVWRVMWPMLCWAPVPEDARLLEMRWWPYWCRHVQVAQAARCPALAWCRPFLAEAAPALKCVYARAGEVHSARLFHQMDKHVRLWFRLWCRGQLIGVLLSGNRVVMGTVQSILHTHTRRGWVRTARLLGWGDVVFEQSASHAHFRWMSGTRERALAARALELPRKVRRRRRAFS